MSTAYRTLWIASILSFLATFGIALPYPVLTPLLIDAGTPLSDWFGLDPKLLLGLVLGAYPLGMLLGANVIGGWSDRRGRRFVVLRTLAGAGLGYGLSLVAILLEDFTLLLLSRLFTGFCEGNIAVFRAMAADLADVFPRTKVFAWSMTATFLGWTFGPMSGGLLGELGADKVFLAGMLVLFAGWLLVAFALHEDSANGKTTAASGQALSLYRLADIRGFAVVHFLACLTINAYYEFFPLWLLERYQLGGLGIAAFTVVLQIGMLASSMWLMRDFERRFGLIPAMHRSLALLGLTLIALPQFPLFYFSVAAFVLIGVVNSTFFGLFTSEYSERFQHYGQGRILGLITFNFSLAALVIALLGALLSLIGSAWVLALGGALGLFALMYLLHLRNAQPYAEEAIHE
ncbi:MAG: hypothetical protein Tsb002_34090 [Wenzhouxiangellaceae bacterium]